MEPGAGSPDVRWLYFKVLLHSVSQQLSLGQRKGKEGVGENEAQATGAHHSQLGGNSHPSRRRSTAPSPHPSLRLSDSEFFTGHGEDRILLISITKMRIALHCLYKYWTSQSILTHSSPSPPPQFVGQDRIITPCLQVRKWRHREVGNCLWSHSWLVINQPQRLDLLI